MNYIKYMLNKKRLLGIVENLVDKYENTDRNPSSCKRDLIDALNQTLERSKQEISEWQDHDTDYIHIAHNQMHMHIADLLCSGRYHIGRGTLNPMSCAPNLRLVFDRCLDYFEQRGELSAADREEYESDLRHNIRCV